MGNPPKGLERLLVRLRPETIAAVKAEARRRADEAGRLQTDASSIVQAALDAHLPKLAKPPPPAKKRR